MLTIIIIIESAFKCKLCSRVVVDTGTAPSAPFMEGLAAQLQRAALPDVCPPQGRVRWGGVL